MSISPWQQFDTEPSWKWPLLLDSAPLTVTGLSVSNFQLILHPTNGGQEIIGSGLFHDLLVSDPLLPKSPPSIIYDPNLNDVSIIGEFRAYMLITHDSGKKETLNLGYIEIQGR
jgi:hypothetical protein